MNAGAGYCWCDMCGYNAVLPAKYRAGVENDHPCPWCSHTTGALLCVGDKLEDHVIPNDPMMTWPDTGKYIRQGAEPER